MIVAERLGLPVESVTVVKGDTDVVPRGAGTYGSKSTQIGGTVAGQAAAEVVERGRGLVADLLEANPADVVLDLDTGRFHTVDARTPGFSWAELAARLQRRRPARRAQRRAGLQAGRRHVPVRRPCRRRRGRHGDRRGRVDAAHRRRRRRGDRQPADRRRAGSRRRRDRYLAGALRRGSLRRGRKSADGEPASPTASPRPPNSPRSSSSRWRRRHRSTPSGVKGIGESGTIGATPAVQNAVVDALAPFGVRHVDMPCSAERVWRALAEAGRQ